jgi:flavorubredoxin
VDEIAGGIYRIHTPFRDLPGGFSFNQFLVVAEQPLLFHTGPHRLFELVREAVASVLSPGSLRFIAFSHHESDECGSLNEWLAAAPHSVPLCGRINAMINGDTFNRPPRVLADGEVLSLGEDHRVRWFDAPHLPHAWECGYLMEEHTRTLLCGDLFTQGGADVPILVETDILEPSEAFRMQMDYFSHTTRARAILDGLARASPTTLACMHGSSWRGDGTELLLALADALESHESGPRPHTFRPESVPTRAPF